MSALWQKCLLASTLLASGAMSAALPPRMEGGKTVQSLLDPKVSLSFKETHICETTPGVKSYSGYVNLPAGTVEGQDYDIHTFFWFFESRKEPEHAPLSIWLQGGPGSPSVVAAIGENGPCRVTADSKDTVLNEWSWNNEVNMLYIDQPVQTGFSYDRIINGTIDETRIPFNVTPTEKYEDVNYHTLAGRFASQDPRSTASTAQVAAAAAWHFMQIWTQQFPVYTPKDNKFSMWGESYGGHYVPTFSSFFESQNQKIAQRQIQGKPLHLSAVGLVNACVDIMTQMPFYPEMAHANTYGVVVSNETEYELSVKAWPACREAIESCRSFGDEMDPDMSGTNPEVNKMCKGAFDLCFSTMRLGYNELERNVFDITSAVPGSFPPKYAAGYLNTESVQKALGVPLNFTGLSSAASAAFTQTGDFVRGKNLQILGELLDRGVKVALMYGDRDFQCNWYGGEAISLGIRSSTHTPGFQAAGYSELLVSPTHSNNPPHNHNKKNIGGMVRQYGNLSFTRVYGAGHEVPYYAPEAAHAIFSRVMADHDVATGTIHTHTPSSPSKCGNGKGGRGVVSTRGPKSIANITNELPAPHRQECYFWDMFETCTREQIGLAVKGLAVFEDFVMTGYDLGNGTVVHFP
ncbi:alpha/beta-hydrolase [Xylariaceae sp. FL0594]|nr:alpha/beta-hydrolase [Xylariaceae sp. FL0594]